MKPVLLWVVLLSPPSWWRCGQTAPRPGHAATACSMSGRIAVQRQRSRSGQRDGFLEILWLVHTRAAESQLTPEKAEQVDLRRLREDGHHDDAPARPRQLRHHLGAARRARNFEHHVRARGPGFLFDFSHEVGFQRIHGVEP